MKPQTTKKLFAFIITVMMFSIMPALVNAQKKCPDGHCPKGQICVNGYCEHVPEGYFCQCGARGYGCTTADCKAYCAAACGAGLIAKNENDDRVSLTCSYHSDSQCATISFALPQSAKITLKIFDLNGVLLKTISDDVLEEGEHTIEWSTAEVNGGVYFIQLQAATSYQMEKLIITK